MLVAIILVQTLLIIVLGFLLHKSVMSMRKKDIEIDKLERSRNKYESALDDLEHKLKIHEEVEDELEERFEEMEHYYELKEILASYTSFTHSEVGDKLDEVLEDNSNRNSDPFKDIAKIIDWDKEVVEDMGEVAFGDVDEWVLKEKDPSKNRYSEQTVWDFNSRYAFCEPSDPVCKCVYLGYAPFEPLGLSRLERANKLQEMDTQDIEYAFPITRIKPDKK